MIGLRNNTTIRAKEYAETVMYTNILVNATRRWTCTSTEPELSPACIRLKKATDFLFYM
jgi:hypothetical protein